MGVSRRPALYFLPPGYALAVATPGAQNENMFNLSATHCDDVLARPIAEQLVLVGKKKNDSNVQ